MHGCGDDPASTVDDQNLVAAGTRFERDLHNLFSGWRVYPAVVVDSIDHAGFCEDGRTFTVSATTVRGETLFVSLCPGEPVAMSLHGEPALPTPNITNVKKVLAGPGWGGEQNPYVVQNDPAVSFF